MMKYNYYLTRSGPLLVIILLLCCLCTISDAQEMERCGTMESLERLMLEYPEYEQNRRTIERRIQEILQRRDVVDGITVIPVVYHVIHNGDAIGTDENLAESQLLAQLDQMNDDFRRMNSDAGNTPADFAGVAADTEIEFCLAQVDPNGNPSTGIERINISTLSGVDPADCWDDDYIDANIKPSTVWNSDNYLNIWTVFKINRSSDCANTILGYAQFPGGPANTDGIVLRATTVGSLAEPNPTPGDFAYGRTGTHEAGHWLNLIHIWGDGDCGDGDGVGDTPNANDPNYTSPPCTYPGPNSCDDGSGDLPDMFQNYMDYSDDLCMNLFTTGQGNRMNAAIAASRPELLTAECGPECVNNLVVSGTLNGIYTAASTISTSGPTTIPSANDVELRAPNTVTLNNGFTTTGFGGLFVGYGICSISGLQENDGEATTALNFQTPELAVLQDRTPDAPGSKKIYYNSPAETTRMINEDRTELTHKKDK